MTLDEPFIHIPPFLDCRDPNQRDPLERVERVIVDSDIDDAIICDRNIGQEILDGIKFMQEHRSQFENVRGEPENAG